MNNVTAVVVLHNGEKLVPQLSETLNALPVGLKTVVYDSDSTDGTVRSITRLLKDALCLHGPNRGFGFGNNRCLEQVTTEYTLLLNSDASIDSDSLKKLSIFLDLNPDYAGVQPLVRLWGWEKVTLSNGVFLTEFGEAWDSRFMHLELAPVKTSQQVPAVTAAVSLWRTSALKSINGFDEDFFMYFEDADLSLRLGASGWKVGVVRDAEATHKVGSSSRRKQAVRWELESSIRVYRRYFGNGRLSLHWWKREVRIVIHSILEGRSPLWRLVLIKKALRRKVDIVVVPDDIKAILFGDPMDYPLPRIQKDSQGPGWKKNTIAPWGALHTNGRAVAFKLTACDHAVTGVISSGNGDILNRFCLSPGVPHLVELAETPFLVYIHCDSHSGRVEVITV